MVSGWRPEARESALCFLIATEQLSLAVWVRGHAACLPACIEGRAAPEVALLGGGQASGWGRQVLGGVQAQQAVQPPFHPVTRGVPATTHATIADSSGGALRRRPHGQ